MQIAVKQLKANYAHCRKLDSALSIKNDMQQNKSPCTKVSEMQKNYLNSTDANFAPKVSTKKA